MQRSTDRILTTHTGSLPRPHDVVDFLMESEKNPGKKLDGFDEAVSRAVADVVKKQIDAGLNVINDGEQGRADYTIHVKDRLTGYDGPNQTIPMTADEDEFPELTEMLRPFVTPLTHRPACTGPVEWLDWDAAQADIDRAASVIGLGKAEDVFMTSPSPGQIARFLPNLHYSSEEEYIFALADVMKHEYEAIVDAGLVLQLDCPDLALSRHTIFKHLSLEDFRKEITMHVEALNHAVRDIPAEKMRMHVCWASTLGPHHEDVPLVDIVDIIMSARPGAVSFPGANPRHEHEWKVWRDVKLPDGKVIIPGVIDTTSNFVEHPELVSDRIQNYASVVGRENVLVGGDCGFGTFAGRVQVDRNIVWMKFKAMTEGAARASEKLWC
ncbi:MAG: cobalamin-independent methionine synthase II family protein [Alphaproteobacteria bacterium]|nr:cobalamin-independent methionine synthase II family protein [Alphaproteobacteria bacterium]